MSKDSIINLQTIEYKGLLSINDTQYFDIPITTLTYEIYNDRCRKKNINSSKT